jgi:hypothetical protein
MVGVCRGGLFLAVAIIVVGIFLGGLVGLHWHNRGLSLFCPWCSAVAGCGFFGGQEESLKPRREIELQNMPLTCRMSVLLKLVC